MIEAGRSDRLIEEYGSPLFVMSEDRLRENVCRLRSAFEAEYPEVQLAYSFKTNYVRAVCEAAAKEGAWAEVVSGLELALACRLGAGARIVFNGPCKRPEELRAAVEVGALVNVDTISEIEALNKIASESERIVPIGVRLSCALDGRAWSRFGFSLEEGEAEEVCHRLLGQGREWTGVRLAGLHMHIGTNVMRTELYQEAAERVVEFTGWLEETYGLRMDYLDLGGGFPQRKAVATWEEECAVEPPRWGEYAAAVGAALRRLAWRPLLILEPGRAVVGDAGVLLTAVVAIRRRSEVTSVVVDAGVSVLPTAYHLRHCIRPTQRRPGPLHLVDVYGPSCMETDVLGVGVEIPVPEIGDILEIDAVGAYSLSMSCQFIQPRPAVVMLRGDRAELVQSRETLENITASDLAPGFPSDGSGYDGTRGALSCRLRLE